MAHDVFVDTSGFYALLVKRDDRHQQAGRFLKEARRRKARFLTTDYVLDETATLLKARGHGHLVPVLLESVFSSAVCAVDWTDPEQFRTACDFFVKHEDHPWSFTDCLSFVVMKRRRVREALTKDAHFREAGFQPLLAEDK